MALVDRIKRLFSAKANKIVDDMENPTEISNQIIRELQEKFNLAVQAEAKVKATNLANKASLVKANEEMSQWEIRVNGILDKIDAGDNSPETAELAKTAAEKYNEAKSNVAKREAIVASSATQIETMAANVKKIQSAIETAKDKSANIKSRQNVADALKTVNEAMSSTNTDNLMGTLDRMEEKVSETEYLAEAYAGSSANSTSASKIDEILSKSSVEDTLAEFRAKRK